MLPFFREACQQDCGHEHGQLRFDMIHAYCEAERVMRACGRFLNPEQARELSAHMTTALTLNNVLATRCVDQFLYKLIPKHHAAQHLCCRLDLSRGATNPRATQCYQDEDFVGRCKHIYASAHGATAAHKSLLRYLVLQGVRWSRRLRVLRGLEAPQAADGARAQRAVAEAPAAAGAPGAAASSAEPGPAKRPRRS
jgi:hypothetical protein